MLHRMTDEEKFVKQFIVIFGKETCCEGFNDDFAAFLETVNNMKNEDFSKMFSKDDNNEEECDLDYLPQIDDISDDA